MASYGADSVVIPLSKPITEFDLKRAHFLNNIGNEWELFHNNPEKMLKLFIISGVSIIGLYLYFKSKKK
jgi:hypothetical protein